MPILCILVLCLLPSVSSYGWETICDATHEVTCYVTLGLPAYVQIVVTNSTYQMDLLKGNDRVFVFRRSKLMFDGYHLFDETIQQRWLFDPVNGTLVINPAEKSDLGAYRVRIYEEKTGTQTSDHKIHLTTRASPPTLSALCFNEERRVACLSDGHEPQYSWSLVDESKSTEEVDFDLSADNSMLSVRAEVPLTFTCTVKTYGDISNVSQTISPCPGLTRSLTWDWASPNGSKRMKIWVDVEDAPLNMTDDDIRSVLRPPCTTGISPVFVSVWLAEIIILTALLVGGYYLYVTKSRPVMPGGRRKQELKHSVLQEPVEEES